VIEQHLNNVPSLKPFSGTTINGKPYLRRDAREKVTGEAQFAGDIRLPGMLYSKIVCPPAHGAKQVSIDTSVAEGIAGVRVVRDDDLVAVSMPCGFPMGHRNSG
jgi:nicotinate dehydrogenase subunit B